MIRFILLIATLAFSCFTAYSQSPYYFPPTGGTTWETKSPQDMGWAPEKIDTLLNYLEARNSKSFMVLHQGKVVIEAYFGDYTANSTWYWASAGKSLTAFLVGMAQDSGLLNIHDSTSHYLGTGWTAATPAQEGDITLFHQLNMTSGLDDRVADDNCTADTCLKYFQPPGVRWAYYNAPYHLLHDVLEAASNKNLNQFTTQILGSRIGMGGFWLNHVRYGKARDMARFGLLSLAKGVWNGDTLLRDTAYFRHMVTPSQALNPAYGYLWWLNGSSFFLQPGIQLPFQGPILPSAPADAIAALGKDDQKIYVVPSLDLVVVRQGDAAYNTFFALSPFDDELWTLIMDLYSPTSVVSEKEHTFSLSPNPASHASRIHLPLPGAARVSVYDTRMQLLATHTLQDGDEIPVGHLPEGLYLVSASQSGTPPAFTRLVVKRQ